MAEADGPQVHSCDYCSKLLIDLWKPSQLEHKIKLIFTELTTRTNVDEKVNTEIISQNLTALEFLEGASVGCEFLAYILYGNHHVPKPQAMIGRKFEGAGSLPPISGDSAVQLLRDPRTRVALQLQYVVKMIRGWTKPRYLSTFYLLLESPAGVYYKMHYSKPFYIHAVQGHPAERYIGRTMPNYRPGSDASVNVAKRWLHNCDSSHSCYKSRGEEKPSRILRLQRIQSGLSVAFLLPGANIDRYAALSYVWGGPQLSTRLIKSRLGKSKAGVQSNLLPKTIQDAITVTLDLGLEFLWVDAHCIVQDDEDEKIRELPKMAAIYRGAYVTISAAAASHSDNRFLHSRAGLASKDRWARIPFRSPEDVLDSIYVPHQLEPVLSSAEAIHSRAWTLQEHILSPRLLIYGSRQLKWSCARENLVDGGELLLGDRDRSVSDGTLQSRLYLDDGGDLITEGIDRVLDMLRGTNRVELELNMGTLNAWDNLVKAYTSRGLTDPSDKLKAVSAVAQHFSTRLRDRYLAGLWRNDLINGLMWYVESPSRDRPARYRAPSWSWASVDDPVQYKVSLLGYSRRQDSRCDESWAAILLACGVEAASHIAPFADVTSGYIKVRAKLRGGINILANWMLYDDRTRHVYPFLMSPDAFGPAYTDISVWCLELSRCENNDGWPWDIIGLVLQGTEQSGIFKRLGVYHDVPGGYTPEARDLWERSMNWDDVIIVQLR